jgi:hypothetical protein
MTMVKVTANQMSSTGTVIMGGGLGLGTDGTPSLVSLVPDLVHRFERVRRKKTSVRSGLETRVHSGI